MKQATIIAALLAVSHLCMSRSIPADHFNKIRKHYSDSALSSIPSMNEMVAQIMNVTGLQTNFEIKQANVPNIEAAISHRKRYILYNRTFIDQVINATKDKWSTFALL